jgi:glycosyltransferase involved in cell wall biosynthesis
MKVFQINSVANSGSTGRIAENIGLVLQDAGHKSYMAYGRNSQASQLNTIKIGSQLDVYAHGIKTVLTDKHGFGSKQATKEFLKRVDEIKPDAIGLHNLHGYYINIELLFNYLKETQIPVLWTLFDCWAFTGHCTYFDDISCEKWKTQCHHCPKTANYPRAMVDNSRWNYNHKKELFTGLKNMELLTHSNWLKELVKKSFLSDYKVNVTPSAIDLETFKPISSNLRELHYLEDKKILLGCANIWSNRKGYKDFKELSRMISEEYQIVMIGLNDKELKDLPNNILGLKRTDSIHELAQWYTLAVAFINPTTQDNFPTTNLEALACGTPVITYNTGGSPEAIDESTGLVVEKGNVAALHKAVQVLGTKNHKKTKSACRSRAEGLYDKKVRYLDYLEIFERLTKQ